MSARESEHVSSDEQPLDPTRPIVDPHQHLWDHPRSTPFLLQDFVRAIAASGHNVTRTIYVECNSMHRCEGPRDLRPIGETEFANGMAAMSASGRYGDCRVASGIVCTANLQLGTAVVPILEAQIAAGNGRLRGVRWATAYTEAGLFGHPLDASRRGILLQQAFRDGVRALQRCGLSLDVWCVHTQLGELADLAGACEATTIVLDHVGTPLELDAALGPRATVFQDWRARLTELARRPNVVIKLGGLGMDVTKPIGGTASTPSSTLAAKWRPYIESCIELFGPQRCMFESNFPVDNATCSYGELWNAFKLIAAQYSAAEQTALFSGTALRVYRLD